MEIKYDDDDDNEAVRQLF